MKTGKVILNRDRQLSLTPVSGFSGLDRETQREAARRLGGFALIYAVGYALAYGIPTLLHPHRAHLGALPVALASIAFGILVYFLMKFERVPLRRFPALAITFEVVAILGISLAGWGWETRADASMQRLGADLGFTGESFFTDFIDVLEASGHNLMLGTEVTWIGVVILLFPMVVPLRPRRVLLGSLLAASAATSVLLLSQAVNGMPETIRFQAGGFIAQITISFYTCALLASLASRAIYKLARDLAHERRMGSYKLTERIGAGGMGEVWLARHRLLARPAAVKLINPEAMGHGDATLGAKLRKRFELEAQATADLHSPHTVQLFDFGITEDNTFYYVMEYLQGFDLRSLVEKFGPLPASRAVHLLGQACHSLRDAHASGLFHRDIKPSNLFICRRGIDYDFVKVLDFGMVKRSDASSGEVTQLTQEGTPMGTPAYMSPEAIIHGEAVDARADIYALGCVAFWLLTGQTVFQGDTPMAICVQHVKDAPPPPSSRTEMEIPESLDRLVLDCLEKDPKDRVRSVSELARRLESIRLEVGDWSQEDARAWWETHSPEPARQIP